MKRRSRVKAGRVYACDRLVTVWKQGERSVIVPSGSLVLIVRVAGIHVYLQWSEGRAMTYTTYLRDGDLRLLR